jgi:hypothetical protein
MALTVGQVVASSYEWVLQRAPYESSVALLELLEGTRLSYRDRLDRPRYNFRGDRLTRRNMVEWNLKGLGSVRMNPARLPL